MGGLHIYRAFLLSTVYSIYSAVWLDFKKRLIFFLAQVVREQILELLVKSEIEKA